MSARATVILLAVFALLCAGYWFMLRGEDRVERVRVEAKRVFSFEPKDVRSAEVRRIDEKPAAAGRRNDGLWAFTKPSAQIEANQVVWDRLAVALAGLSCERVIEQASDDKAKYGLDTPVLTLAADTAKGAVQLDFGAVEPTQTYRYARLIEAPEAALPAGSVFLISAKEFNELDRPLKFLRNPYAFNIGETGITRVEFARYWTPEQAESVKGTIKKAADRAVGEESVVCAIEKNESGIWRMTEPYEAAANQQKIEEFVKELQYATGNAHIDEPEHIADYGLDPPAARITVFSGPDVKQTLLVGMSQPPQGENQGGGLFVKRDDLPSVFIIDPQVLTLLPRTPDGFREARLLTREAVNLTRMHYVCGDTDIVLENDPEKGWRLTQPPVDDTDQLAVSNFIGMLKQIEGRGFPEPDPAAFENPAVLIELTSKDSAAEGAAASIKIGKEVPNVETYYAQQDNGSVTMVNKVDVMALRKSVFHFRAKKLMPLTAADACQVNITLDGKEYVFEKIRAKWAVRTPADSALPNSADMDLLLKSVQDLKAVAVVTDEAPADLTPLGLAQPVAAVTVLTRTEVDGQPREQTFGPLLLGAPNPENSSHRHAMTKERPGIYLIDQAFMDELRETLGSVK